MSWDPSGVVKVDSDIIITLIFETNILRISFHSLSSFGVRIQSPLGIMYQKSK